MDECKQVNEPWDDDPGRKSLTNLTLSPFSYPAFVLNNIIRTPQRPMSAWFQTKQLAFH